MVVAAAGTAVAEVAVAGTVVAALAAAAGITNRA